MGFEAVLFDMDGSLIDSEILHFTAWKDLLGRFGHDIPAGWVDMFIGVPDADALQFAVEQIPDLGGKISLAAKEEIFGQLAAEKGDEFCFPGVAEGLAKLENAGLKLAVGTNSVMHNTRANLELAGLGGFFETIYTLDTVAAGKPAPDIYQACLRELEVTPEKAVVVEDSVAGIKAGLAAGCLVLGVTTTLPAEKIAMADKIFASTVDAIDWILAQA